MPLQKQALPADALPENARIVQASFLQKASHPKDLVRRLRKVCHVLLSDAAVEAHSEEWPGLARLAQHLAAPELLAHATPTVRLLTSVACMEIFAIYAPECPWTNRQVCRIFAETTAHLANLAVHTSSAGGADSHYPSYARLLQLLSDVKIGCVLTELAMEFQDEVVPAVARERDEDDEENLDLDEEDDDDQEVEAPLPLLVHLVHTLLHCLRRAHAADTKQQVVNALVACVDEYTGSLPLPTVLLDELLLCVAAGPTQLVVDPKAAASLSKSSQSTKAQPLKQVAVENPQFRAAARILETLQSRLTTAVGSLVNGLLRQDAHVVQASRVSADPAQALQGDDVWSCVRHLPAIAPAFLTTVLGTVAHQLESPDAPTRLAAVQVLGHVFCGAPRRVLDYYAVYTTWLARQNDVHVDVRHALRTALLPLVAHWGSAAAPLSTMPATALELSVTTLMHLTVQDPSVAVRQAGLHAICERLYANKASLATTPTAGRLLQAVGRRVESRQPGERQDALTGLVKLYWKHGMAVYLQPLLTTMDVDQVEAARQIYRDCGSWTSSRRGQRRARQVLQSPSRSPMRTILGDSGEEGPAMYAFIPKLLFCAAQFPDMKNRILHLMDSVLLGASSKSKVSPVAQAVGLALVLDSVREEGDDLLAEERPQAASLKFLHKLLSQRALVQHRLAAYLAQRKEWKGLTRGTEEALASESQCLEHLRQMASLSGHADLEQSAFRTLHKARDQHIFRLLATIATPIQTAKTRQRALDELPKRCQSLGDTTLSWIKQLVRQCVMGDFLNADTVHQSIVLAKECLYSRDFVASAAFLSSAKLAATIFPALCGQPKTFGVLTELFTECRGRSDKEEEATLARLLTALSSMLSQASMARATDRDDDDDDTTELRSDLVRLCTGEGTPLQAQNAVYTLSRLGTDNATPGTPPLKRLVHKLASPSYLSQTADIDKQITILSALSALADCAPEALASEARGAKALVYALEYVLMGRGSGDESSSDDDEDTKRPSPRKNMKPKHQTPVTQSVLEDESLSTPCRRVCAAIAFLVSHIRSSRLSQGTSKEILSEERIQHVFALLVQILQDKGLPPNDRDRKKCTSRQDRAALRQVAGRHLLRLCDARLGLERIHLSVSMWHTLGAVFLDEEQMVRESVVNELSLMLTGGGVFGMDKSKREPQAPSLRFVAYATLCVDADSSHDSSAANAFAANLGKSGIKAAALQCVTNLRTVCDGMYTHCRATGKEQFFETFHKMRLMPEYVVPFVFHLLAMRRETPGGVLASSQPDDSSSESESPVKLRVDEDIKQRILAKRLKVLLDPLVRSLGDGADNISFLYRMSELLGNKYAAVPLDTAGKSRAAAALKVKLGKISGTAGDILKSFIKKDVNLEHYPGTVNVPPSLFVRSFAKKKPSSRASKKSTQALSENTPVHATAKTKQTLQAALMKSPQTSSSTAKPSSLSKKKRSSNTPTASPKPSGVHFSPDLEMRNTRTSRSKNQAKGFGDNLSPIHPRRSPFASALSPQTAGTVRDTQTLGSTPPSDLKISTMRSTQVASESEEDEAQVWSSQSVESALPSGLKLSLSSDVASEEDREEDDRSMSLASQPVSTQSTMGSSVVLGRKPSPKKGRRSSKVATPPEVHKNMTTDASDGTRKRGRNKSQSSSTSSQVTDNTVDRENRSNGRRKRVRTVAASGGNTQRVLRSRP